LGWGGGEKYYEVFYGGLKLGTQPTGEQMGPKACLKIFGEKKRLLPLPGNQIPDHPTHSPVTIPSTVTGFIMTCDVW